MVNVTTEEELLLKKIVAQGIEVFLQGVPSEQKKEYR